MQDTHHVRRVKLFKDAKVDKCLKLMLLQNDETKKHINTYKQKYQEA